ncbi:DNA recombination protein RmuC [Mycoplasma feriruminatoris]|uniref:DNA recombination protein RmuC n=1 Tax=Mycoplasma feriruminatoris TaxID=1179777 RepID=UPI0002A4E647|nr:DNA recombination protein RmuC [Mycoplasma feriruminatoris]UKS54241.1 rmuC family protein [Mycoplasma feriruminatoris]VZK65413.1 hypothetical protein MF5292_00588 [Mycoplasma feriruminatoris]VZR75558.1 hypothetical protein MF5294_00588 [Mycoplasma feriruminatoris]VZR97999.1 hypothetical protein MF5293_00585 [Mycoplasma feriruminatoris]
MDLTIILIILISILIIICISILFYLIKNKNKVQDSNLKDNLEYNKETINQKIESENKVINTNLDNLKEKVNEQKTDLKQSLDKLEQNISKFNEITKNIEQIDKKVDSSSNNIKELSLIFKNSKTRGNLGEYTLESILTNVLGQQTKNGIWQTQYKYKNSNVIVDAIINTQINDKKIAIDAKFPLSKTDILVSQDSSSFEYKQAEIEFKSSIKTMIKDLNNKYISSEENISSVIMFIPSEIVFELIWSKFSDLFNEAVKNKIWICSPTTLPAVLFSQQISIRDYKISKNITEIQRLIKVITDDVKRLLERNENILASYEKYKSETERLFKEFQISASKIDKNYSKLESINMNDNQE